MPKRHVSRACSPTEAIERTGQSHGGGWPWCRWVVQIWTLMQRSACASLGAMWRVSVDVGARCGEHEDLVSYLLRRVPQVAAVDMNVYAAFTRGRTTRGRALHEWLRASNFIPALRD